MSEEHDFAGIDFIDEQERLYFAQARLGSDTLMFMRSPVGRYLHGRAKQEVDEVKEELLDCNPDSFFGRRKIRKLQKKSNTAQLFMRWCVDIIEEGEVATKELENYRG